MPHHALEITLTHPLPPPVLHRAARRLRRRLGARLPIDVITTHYPDADHSVLLNIAFPPAVHAALTAGARRAQQTLERFLELAVHRALAEHADRETERLDHAVRQLLAHTTPAYLLSAVGHALARLPERPTP